jgi:hypothetical protein
MSRSGYYEYDEDDWANIRWRGAVVSAIRGRRGQALLREMLAALDALEGKRLIAGDLVRDGEVCALGAVGKSRGLSMDDVDPQDLERVAGIFGIAPALATEIAYMNDDFCHRNMSPEKRFDVIRRWVSDQILKESDAKKE